MIQAEVRDGQEQHVEVSPGVTVALPCRSIYVEAFHHGWATAEECREWAKTLTDAAHALENPPKPPKPEPVAEAEAPAEETPEAPVKAKKGK